MKRTMIYLDEAQHQALQMEARSSGRPMAEIVREAVSAYLVSRKVQRRDTSLVGMLKGLAEDNASERVDEVIAADFHGSY